MQIGDEVEILSIEPGSSIEAHELFAFLKGHTFYVDDVSSSNPNSLAFIVTNKYHGIKWYYTHARNVRKI